VVPERVLAGLNKVLVQATTQAARVPEVVVVRVTVTVLIPYSPALSSIVPEQAITPVALELAQVVPKLVLAQATIPVVQGLAPVARNK